MAFVSDLQRKHFFANGGGSGASVPSFPVRSDEVHDGTSSAMPESGTGWGTRPDGSGLL